METKKERGERQREREDQNTRKQKHFDPKN